MDTAANPTYVRYFSKEEFNSLIESYAIHYFHAKIRESFDTENTIKWDSQIAHTW
jgi:hypothetical protein